MEKRSHFPLSPQRPTSGSGNRDEFRAKRGIREIILGNIMDVLSKKERILMPDAFLPVTSEALEALTNSELRLPQLKLTHIVGVVRVDLLVVDPLARHAIALMIGGRSTEEGAATVAKRSRHLRAAEITLVDYLRQLGHAVDVGVLAVLAMGECTRYPEDVVVRIHECDALLDASVSAGLIRDLRKASASGESNYRPRFVGINASPPGCLKKPLRPHSSSGRTSRPLADDDARAWRNPKHGPSLDFNRIKNHGRF